MRDTLIRHVLGLALLGAAAMGRAEDATPPAEPAPAEEPAPSVESPSRPAPPPAPPCLADVKRLCGLIPPAGNFVQSCLEARSDQLSKACREHVDTLTKDTTVLLGNCRWDLARFCSDVTDAAGEHVGCLMRHRESLSAKCRERLDADSTD